MKWGRIELCQRGSLYDAALATLQIMNRRSICVCMYNNIFIKTIEHVHSTGKLGERIARRLIQ